MWSVQNTIIVQKRKKKVLMVKIILSDNYDIATKGIKHNWRSIFVCGNE